MWCLLWLGCASTPEDLHARGLLAASEGDLQAALDAFEAACAREHVASCAEGGSLSGVDPARRAALNEAACEGDEPRGCLARSGSPGDRWVQRACELGAPAACVAAGIAADDPRDAARFMGQACHDGDHAACTNAARRWAAMGELVKAAALAEAGCAAVPTDGACALGRHWRHVETLRQACARGEAAGCVAVCEQLREPAACAASREPAETACASGTARACTVRAEAGIVTGEPDDTVNDWLWRGCDTVDPLGCLRLADRLERGAGARPARARGGVAWLRNQACDLQLDYACAPHAGWR